MFERPVVDPRCVLVSLDVGGVDAAAHLEFEELACSAGAEIVGRVTGRRAIPEPKYFIGAGKAQEVRALVQQTGAGLVLVNHPLSPSQERNLEALIESRVLDRTGLILDIFAQRAQSFEGKLQVELAQLRHLATRLVRGWSHLERQKGGIGLRGPGETQLESDRRMLRARMGQLERRLARVGQQREQGRALRQRSAVPTVALVGYTNAGKSTLFNGLTGAGAYAADQLFATLDPTARRLDLGTMGVVMIDTVGFVRDLPHELVAAFRATLEETRQADLLLHVIDAADEEADLQVAAVDEVLEQIGAADIPRLQVFNKIDLTEWTAGVQWDDGGKPVAVRVSAHTGTGIDKLRDAIRQHFQGRSVSRWLHLTHGEGRMRARLHAAGAVRAERFDESGWWLEIEGPAARLASLTHGRMDDPDLVAPAAGHP
jgi:GTP-binding protein HflX